MEQKGKGVTTLIILSLFVILNFIKQELTPQTLSSIFAHTYISNESRPGMKNKAYNNQEPINDIIKRLKLFYFFSLIFFFWKIIFVFLSILKIKMIDSLN